MKIQRSIKYRTVYFTIWDIVTMDLLFLSLEVFVKEMYPMFTQARLLM